MKLDINDSIEVKSRAEYRRLLRSWASQTGSRPVYEYDGPGVYRPLRISIEEVRAGKN